ncbi:MAG: GTPase Era [Pseudomonadota bacterium]
MTEEEGGAETIVDQAVGEAVPVERQRCGVVALLGAPNVGKSTLVNQLVGAKVSIVTHKVQTTRARVRGVLTEGDAQIVLVDTPGIFTPRRRLDRAMVEAAWAGAEDADIVLFIVDAAKGLDEDGERILGRLAQARGPVVLLLNKIDLIQKDKLLQLVAQITETQDFDETYMISALGGDGVADLRDYLSAQMPSGPWLFPDDDLSDLPMRMLAAEITREKLYLRLHQELPYASTVETTEWKTLRDGSARIEQTIFVERASQKQIVLGKSGRTIKAISSEARTELRDIVGTDVHLFLFVKVRENWGDDPERFREMGLEFPKA